MVTIWDVARKASVSKSTVSRVLRGGSASEATRQRVLKAVKELGYYPNAAARGLKGRENRTIGVVVSNVGDPYFASMIRGVYDCAGERGYFCLLASSYWEEERELSCLRLLREGRVDGLLILSGRVLRSAELVDDFLQAAGPDRPIVAVDRRLEHPRIHAVVIDNRKAAQHAVEHLIEHGHQIIGHLAGPPDTTSAIERREGYLAALWKARLPQGPDLVAEGYFQKEGGYLAAKRLLARVPRPTAIFAANDLMALGAWKAAREEGLSVPEDLALVGFDDVEVLGLAEVPLTTVRQPRYEMGKAAAAALLDRAEDQSKCLHGGKTLLPTRLVTRRSCGCGS